MQNLVRETEERRKAQQEVKALRAEIKVLDERDSQRDRKREKREREREREKENETEREIVKESGGMHGEPC